MRQFIHYLHDTLVLLGASPVAKVLDRLETVTLEDINELRALNCRLIDATKDKMANIHYIGIKAVPK